MHWGCKLSTVNVVKVSQQVLRRSVSQEKSALSCELSTGTEWGNVLSFPLQAMYDSRRVALYFQTKTVSNLHLMVLRENCGLNSS